ncbi:MAG: hypothetical protein JO278_13575 [Dyella sp.]|nr:hypothetical protein [Dyella sp.]
MTEPEQDLFKRVGYYDFRAYTQLTSGGLSQGFVLARHHTLVGTVQTVFRAGKPCPQSSEALSLALEKLDQLAAFVTQEPLPLGSGEQSI